MKLPLVCTLCAIGYNALMGEPFPENIRVGFVGDSLTSQGGYHRAILLFYATRYPNRKITFKNFGISGDRSFGCAKRYIWDIRPYHATALTISNGVNDVDRGLYTDKTPDANNLARRQAAIDAHIKGTEDFIKLAQTDGTKVIVVSPALFDQTAEIEAPKQIGINDSLRLMAEGDRKTAEKYGCQFIDINTPMLEINRKGQSKDSKFTIVGGDRIHPQAPGHLIMGYYILKAQGVSSIVAKVSLDVKDKNFKELGNCKIANLMLSENAVSFDYLANALPFPFEQRQLPALDFIPFNEDLNNEIFQIRNLASGKYEVVIDGISVQTVTAEQLAAGVNLATNGRTPQHKQAMALRDIINKRGDLENQLKIHSLLKQQFFADKPDMPWEEEKALLEDVHAKLGKIGIWNTFRSNSIEKYLTIGPRREQLQKKVAELSEKIYEINKPSSHKVIIKQKLAK